MSDWNYTVHSQVTILFVSFFYRAMQKAPQSKVNFFLKMMVINEKKLLKEKWTLD